MRLDRYDELEAQVEDRQHLTGTFDDHDPRVQHDEALAREDRRREKADEQWVALTLHPRTGHVQVQPHGSCPVDLKDAA